MLLTLLSLLLGAGGENLLVNPRFEQNLGGWRAEPAGITASVTDSPEGHAVRLEVTQDQPVDWRFLLQRLPVNPGELFCAKAEGRVETLHESQGAALSLWFLDAGGKRIAHVDHYAPTDVKEWTPLQVRGLAPEGAVQAAVLLVLHGHGCVYFRNTGLWRHDLPKPEPLSGEPVTLTVTPEQVCGGLIGFGAEDDGWTYSQFNRDRGADEAGYALRESRIAWMEPDYVRMFFWYQDWNPSLDAETFTWDSDNMQSHYRSLDLYQKLGTAVNVAGVEWGVKDMWANPERLAKAIGTLLHCLIKVKGYSCVKYWTLSNEPNLSYIRSGESFEKFTEIQRLVKEEIKRLGLDIRVVGSDDGNGEDWYARCVREDAYFAAADLFASHFYWGATDLPFAAEVFAGRVEKVAAKQPRKPFIVAEFGFQDGRTEHPNINPFMEEYPYALQAQSCFIDGLNAGVAGFSMWCMHEAYYPGGSLFMHFGLWNFADRGWAVRPIYHVVTSFCRNTEPGDPVWKCVSTHPDWVKGVKAGNTLFWVNLSDTETPIEIRGFTPKTLRIMTETTLTGDRECGSVVEGAEAACFAAPPKSFGYAQ